VAPIGKPKRRVVIEPLPGEPTKPREAPREPVREPVSPKEPKREKVPA